MSQTLGYTELACPKCYWNFEIREDMKQYCPGCGTRIGIGCADCDWGTCGCHDDEANYCDRCGEMLEVIQVSE